MRIETREQLSIWLRACYGLEDAVVEAVDPTLAPDVAPNTVAVRLSLQTGGSIRAGEARHMKRYSISALGVRTYTLAEPAIAGHCCEGAETFESESPIALALDVPGELRLECAALEVAESDYTEIVPAWYSDREYSVTARCGLPSPAEWCDLFARADVPVAWRIYGDKPAPADAVPRDYTGWFLQRSDRIGDTLGGLFIAHCSDVDGAMRIAFSNAYADAVDLWAGAGALVADLRDAEISCGNVTLGGDAWLRYLAEKFPGNLIVRRASA